MMQSNDKDIYLLSKIWTCPAKWVNNLRCVNQMIRKIYDANLQKEPSQCVQAYCLEAPCRCC